MILIWWNLQSVSAQFFDNSCKTRGISQCINVCIYIYASWWFSLLYHVRCPSPVWAINHATFRNANRKRKQEIARVRESGIEYGAEFMILSAVKHFQLIKSINYENIIWSDGENLNELHVYIVDWPRLCVCMFVH